MQRGQRPVPVAGAFKAVLDMVFPASRLAELPDDLQAPSVFGIMPQFPVSLTEKSHLPSLRLHLCGQRVVIVASEQALFRWYCAKHVGSHPSFQDLWVSWLNMDAKGLADFTQTAKVLVATFKQSSGLENSSAICFTSRMLKQLWGWVVVSGVLAENDRWAFSMR